MLVTVNTQECIEVADLDARNPEKLIPHLIEFAKMQQPGAIVSTMCDGGTLYARASDTPRQIYDHYIATRAAKMRPRRHGR